MGFFDSVMNTNATAASSTATATAPAPVADIVPETHSGDTLLNFAPAAKETPSDNGDFLIIDENVKVENVPSVVVDAAPASTEPMAELLIVDTPESAVMLEAPVVTELPVAEMTETLQVDVLSTESASIVSFDEIATPVTLTDVETPEMAVEVLETVESVPETAMPEAVVEADSFFSAGIGSAPVSVQESETSVADSGVVASSVTDPDVIVESAFSEAISRLVSVVESKETARDAEVTLAEELNVKIAELKKQAKEAQENARKIDASADRARSLIKNLKSQLPIPTAA